VRQRPEGGKAKTGDHHVRVDEPEPRLGFRVEREGGDHAKGRRYELGRRTSGPNLAGERRH
jgi:hypothetical protein